MSITRERVLDVLRKIEDPFSKKDIVSADIVRAPTVECNDVRFVLEVEAAQGVAMEAVRTATLTPFGQMLESRRRKVKT